MAQPQYPAKANQNSPPSETLPVDPNPLAGPSQQLAVDPNPPPLAAAAQPGGTLPAEITLPAPERRPPQVIPLGPVSPLPGAAHTPASRRFQGIPSLAITPQGRRWAIWYAGPTPAEDRNNYVVIAAHDGPGADWIERSVIDPDGPGPVRAFDPQAWIAPDGRLWLFWAQGLETHNKIGPSGVWAMTKTTPDGPDTASLSWAAPRRLCDGVMMGKPVVLSTREWALPVSFWHRRAGGSAAVVVSDDQGATWHARGACDVQPAVRSFDEHMLVERRDGTLWMWVRATYGIGESVSRDRGATWPALRPSALQHPSSRFFIRRLASGNLLLVKHGPLYVRTGRSHLTAYLSRDDGAKWLGGLLLDARNGVSYPDGQQDAGGAIHIIYDYDRTGTRAILTACFREADVLAGRLVSPDAALQQVVSAGT